MTTTAVNIEKGRSNPVVPDLADLIPGSSKRGAMNCMLMRWTEAIRNRSDPWPQMKVAGGARVSTPLPICTPGTDGEK